MKRFLFGALILTLVGCSAHQPIKGVCRHDAVYAAIVYGEDHPARIRFGPTKIRSVWHAQAQVLIKDRWLWLKAQNGTVWISEQDDFDPLNTYTVKDFIQFLKLKEIER